MDDGILFDGDTPFGHYEVVDTIYSGRPARVLYSGARHAAQSGIARDDKPELLFDYNERFMELARGLLPRSVLVIGGGACTLPRALLSEFPDLRLDIVELDRALLDIAQRYFDFQPSTNTRLFAEDARTFLNKTSDTYDLIFIDVFTHSTIPAELQTLEAAASLKSHLQSGGTLAMNVIAAYHGARSGVLRRQIAAFEASFHNVELFPAGSGTSLWLPQNFVLTANDNEETLGQYLRPAPLAKLATNPGDAIQDKSLA